jgi:nitroreductase
MSKHAAEVCTPNVSFNGANTDSFQGHFLLKYAVSAPSCLNAQPWLFKLIGNDIKIILDLRRWRKIADADQRELYISAGCVLENILIAAEHFRFSHQVHYGEDEEAAIIELNPSGKASFFRDPSLFEAIAQRNTNRKIYTNKAISPEILKLLQEVCIEEGLKLHLTCDMEIRRKANDLLKQACSIQLSNAAFRRELGYWLGQGLFGDSLTRSKITQLIEANKNMSKNRAKKFSELLMSASVFGIISSEKNDRMSQMKAGQILERTWLRATALGIGLHPISQFLELPELKEKAEKLILADNAYLQLTFGLGYAETVKRQIYRRPKHEFIV